MANVTGWLKDFRPVPLGTTAVLVFRPWGPAGTPTGSLLAPREVRESPDSAGAFSADLVAITDTNPPTPYRLTIEWLGPGGTLVEEVPWAIVVPAGGGRLVDMFADVKPGVVITKGDKGDSGNAVQQAAIDALIATDRTHTSQIAELQRQDLSHAETLSTHRRLIDGNAAIARSYTDARTQGVLDIIDTSNVDRDTDGAPFVHFGSTTVAILQDTDGTPYYKARS